MNTSITLRRDMDPSDLLVVVLISSQHLTAMLVHLDPLQGPRTLLSKRLDLSWHDLEEAEQRARLKEIVHLACGRMDVDPRAVFLSRSDVSITSRVVEGHVSFQGLVHGISEHEMDWARRIAEERPAGTDQELIDLIPVRWEVHGAVTRDSSRDVGRPEHEEKKRFPLDQQCRGLSCHALQILARRGYRDELAKLALAAGFGCDGVIAQPAALYRGIAGQLGEKGSSLVIDCGARHTSFLVRSGDRLTKVMTHEFGGDDITRRIASELGIPFDQAEILKREADIRPLEGAPGHDRGQQTIWTGTQAARHELLPEASRISRSVIEEFFTARAHELQDDPDHPLPRKGQIHLVGRASRMGGLTVALEAIFGHKVVLGSGKPGRDIGDELDNLMLTGLMVSAIEQRRHQRAREGRGLAQILRSGMGWLMRRVE